MPGPNTYDVLLNKFQTLYGRSPEVSAYAPGRVEVLGNHTDYNEGFALAAAINLGTYFAVAPRDDGIARLTAGDIMETVEFPADNPQPSRTHAWSNYIKGMHAGLSAHGDTQRGYDAMFLGNLPVGSGLSSSAALEMSAGLALARYYNLVLEGVELAKIGQAGERTFAGTNCGLLDQLTSLYGEKDALVLCDFRTLETKTVPVQRGLSLLLCDTGVTHELSDGAYNQRRKSCEDAAAYFDTVLPHEVKSLRDVSWEEWKRHKAGMDEVTARRAAHPIGENERVNSGVELLRNDELEEFGRLMYESHDSSRHFFKNSCEELDVLVDAAKALPGVLGARLTGGGFGGSVVTLARTSDTEAVGSALRNVFSRKYGVRCDTRVVHCSAGARLLN